MSKSTETQTNPLEMNDEDFLKMNGPPAVEDASEDEDSPSEEEEEDSAEETAETSEEASEEAADQPEEEDSETDSEQTETAEAVGNEQESEDSNVEETSDTPAETSEKPEDSEKSESGAKDSETPDYEGFYKQIMAPFKANGKMIELRDPSEVIQLMQMGANYTKKLQDIQPHRKVLMMLQNNALLDEGKLSFLIDLDKKNPEAIRQLVKDSGIDPMDIDTESEPTYRKSNHSVPDEEVQFRTVLDDIASTDAGNETLQVIQRDFDDASKNAIWKQPDIIPVIHEQRQNGIYAKIDAEVSRRKTLGQFSGTPYIEAYLEVGRTMFMTRSQTSNPTPGPVSRTPIEQRAAKPKPRVSNGDRAKAAANRGSSSRTKPALVNPLAMSDEAFLELDALKSRL